MVYDPNIPQPADALSDSQADIQENFAQLNTQFGEDHVSLTSGSNNGKHNKSTYIEQTADPSTSSDEIALYSKDVTGNTRIFMRQETNGTIFQLSGSDPVNSLNGRTFLPGKILMQWGSVAAATNGTVVNFGVSFSSNAYSVQVMTIGNTSNIYSIDTITSSSFRYISNGGSFNIRWMAIGAE